MLKTSIRIVLERRTETSCHSKLCTFKDMLYRGKSSPKNWKSGKI